MNRLRVVALASSGGLSVVLGWTFFAYNGLARPLPYAVAAGIALAIPVLPRVLAHGKVRVQRRLRHLRGGTEFSDERGTVFESSSRLGREELFATVEGVVEEAPAFDGVRTEEFPEGPGLIVTYAGFHSLSVRVTEGGHTVVTGASKRSRQFVDRLERECPLSFARVETSPLLDAEPIRGGPRVLLAALLVVAAVGGAAVAVETAYANDPYNTAEKFTLVAMDTREAVDPGFSETDLQLRKAAFLVTSLREEAVEIQWSTGSVDRVHANAVQALHTDRDVRRLLRNARSGPMTDAEAARAERIEADLRRADRRVAAAIGNRTGRETDELDGDLRDVRRRLLNASTTPVAPRPGLGYAARPAGGSLAADHDQGGNRSA